MCRLYGFLANEPTKVDCSLVYAQNALMQQSRVDESGLDHTDGWGIATYEDGWPVVQKKTTAAYDCLMFSATAEKAYSKTIVAHIRHATVGQNSLENTHPFVFGRWTFAHNGTVAGFADLKDRMESETAPRFQSTRIGQTDSEQYFLWLISRLDEHGIGEDSIGNTDEARVTGLLTDLVGDLYERCLATKSDEMPRLNFILTNGEVMVACRWNHSLHMIERTGIYDCEICGIPHIHHSETVRHRAVGIASEPVSHENWRELSNQSIVMVNRNFELIA